MAARFLLLLGVVALASCTGGGRTSVPGDATRSDGALRSHLRALAEPPVAADSAQAASRARYAAGRMRDSGLMPVLESRFLTPAGRRGLVLDPSQAHVLGYIAGRHPSYADDLVLVAAQRDGVGGAAALEAARILAVEARYTQVPGRSVLVALWAANPGLGLRDYLANPTWATERIHRALLVSSDTADARTSQHLLDGHGLASEVVTVAVDSLVMAGSSSLRLSEAASLTDALLVRMRAAATDAPAP